MPEISAELVIHIYEFEKVLYVVGPMVLYADGRMIRRPGIGDYVKAYHIIGDKFPQMPDSGFSTEEELQAWIKMLKANGLKVEEI